jgi:hypothetical protein
MTSHSTVGYCVLRTTVGYCVLRTTVRLRLRLMCRRTDG